MSGLLFASKMSMNVILIHVKMVELVWMKSMNTVVPVFLDTLDLSVKQVEFISLIIE